MTHSNPGQSALADEQARKIEWQFRPYREGDIPGIVAVINAVDEAYNLRWGTSEENMRVSLTAPRQDPQRQIVVVDGPRLEGVPNGVPLGFGRLGYDDAEEKNERIYNLRVEVHPAAEGRGLEHAIAERLLGIIQEYERDPQMRKVEKVRVVAWVREELGHIRELFEGLGLNNVRWFWTMARPLDEPIDEPQPVDGVIIRPYIHPEDNERALAAFNNSFADHFDHHDVLPDDWQHWMGSLNMRLDLSWLAERADTPGQIVGFCICAIHEARNKRRNAHEGWIDLLGTSRDFRRKGLGRALLVHGLHSLRSAGMDTALLEVDSESLTGASRLYESVGFRMRSRAMQYECVL